ncbi:hypothetical protein T05_10706 [Trichinella murrelli]|uniref:Uncharacterized protein n=1 Tax=Trichinella murrelli TaxID=144512 RepID=A0A0V0SPZ7_9BILA|nr:hypothetical protein T05_10706 [Trichinella murrelli]
MVFEQHIFNALNIRNAVDITNAEINSAMLK